MFTNGISWTGRMAAALPAIRINVHEREPSDNDAATANEPYLHLKGAPITRGYVSNSSKPPSRLCLL